MPDRGNERVVYFNGDFVPEREALIPFRDRSFRLGDGVFDMTRTFDGRIFRLGEHIERFYASLRYVRIDPGMAAQEMIQINEEVLERNRHLIGPGEDYWVAQRISRGVDAVGDEGWGEFEGPNVIIDCTPLPLEARASLFRDEKEHLLHRTEEVEGQVSSIAQSRCGEKSRSPGATCAPANRTRGDGDLPGTKSAFQGKALR